MTAELPEPFAVVAFEVILSSALSERSPSGKPRLAEHSAEIQVGPSAALAKRLGVSKGAVDEVFAFSADGVDVLLPASRLPAAAAASTRVLAVLIAAARQGAGIEETTPVEVVRALCEEYKRYDPKNFMTTLTTIDELKVHGSGKARTLRLLRPGWESASEAVVRLGEQA